MLFFFNLKLNFWLTYGAFKYMNENYVKVTACYIKHISQYYPQFPDNVNILH